MKKILFVMICSLCSVIAMQSCKPNDQKVLTEIEKVLKNHPEAITPTISEGVVTLVGSVESEQQKSAIESAIRAINGVKSVNNNIKIIEKEPEVVINQDDIIVSSVNSLLNTAGFKDIKVEVKNGEVTLSGNLKKSDLAKVMQIANEAKPKKVINNLTLK